MVSGGRVFTGLPVEAQEVDARTVVRRMIGLPEEFDVLGDVLMRIHHHLTDVPTREESARGRS